MKIEDIIFDNKKYINITFRNEMHPINVLSDTVDKIMIQDGFIKLHDAIDDEWHCYNLNIVASYHFPGRRRIVNN